MSEYMISHHNYLQSLSFTDIEKCLIDWTSYRVPFNYQNKVIKINPPLSQEEFEREQDSIYNVKKYHFSFKRPEELTEEVLKRTYLNL